MYRVGMGVDCQVWTMEKWGSGETQNGGLQIREALTLPAASSPTIKMRLSCFLLNSLANVQNRPLK
jgi:hypothetical protein